MGYSSINLGRLPLFLQDSMNFVRLLSATPLARLGLLAGEFADAILQVGVGVLLAGGLDG